MHQIPSHEHKYSSFSELKVNFKIFFHAFTCEDSYWIANDLPWARLHYISYIRPEKKFFF